MAYTGTSIVDYLNSQKKDSSFAARKTLYQSKYGANTPYTGSAEQNTALLKAMNTPLQYTNFALTDDNTPINTTTRQALTTPTASTAPRTNTSTVKPAPVSAPAATLAKPPVQAGVTPAAAPSGTQGIAPAPSGVVAPAAAPSAVESNPGGQIGYTNPGDQYGIIQALRDLKSENKLNDLQATADYIKAQTGNIDSLFGNQYNSQVSQLRRAAEMAKQGLGSQKMLTEGQYQGAADQTVLNKLAEEKRIKEILANMGMNVQGAQSGENITAQTALAGQFGRQMNDINLAKAAKLLDISERQRQIESGLPEQELALLQGMDAQKAQALIDLQNRADTRDFNLAGLQNQYGQQNFQNLLSGIQSLSNLDNSAFEKALATAQYGEGQRQFNVGQGNWERQLAEGTRQFDSQMSENQRQFDQNYSFNQQQQTFQERQSAISNAVNSGQLSMQQAQLQLQKDKWKAENDPNSLDNQYKKAQIGAINTKDATQSTNKVAAIAADLDSMTPGAAYSELVNNPSEYIADIGTIEYNRLLTIYENKAGM